ncbi:helix-turn-helix domain-containing protein [Phaeacidiphilus oryzae]|uniref:helix-turn-helix domain-containing protein n=1 Tax=Phaeacidiphilus oryzae TaxID=348818 RepID=UPI000A06627E|nr:helix-turn-helix transcriptional regulator [Phaeacidiphilus oryzae]
MGLDHTVELSEFLRSRRARLTPESVGLPPAVTGSARRVPGLRREELAQLAGVSTDYYTRLEQGRHRNVSASVLEAIARALQLDETEQAYLVALAQHHRHGGGRRHSRSARPRRVRPSLHQMLGALDAATPALITDSSTQVLAANRLARSLYPDFEAMPYRERNLARLVFLDESARDLFPDWAEVAEDTAANLRLAASRDCEDSGFCELIGELAVKSPEFRTTWAKHTVRRRSHGHKRFRHPQVGELALEYEVFAPADEPDQTLFIYTAEPGSPSETALQLLANLSLGDADKNAGRPTQHDTDSVESHRI